MSPLWWLVSAVFLAIGLYFALGFVWGSPEGGEGKGSSSDAAPDSEPIITPPPKGSRPWEAPELAEIPFDADAYRAERIAAKVATLIRYTPDTACVKCGAKGNPDPHHAKLNCLYFVPPHATENENDSRRHERKKLEFPDTWWRSMDLGFGYGWNTHQYPGPQFISRTCFKCGFTWDELALDETIPASQPTEKAIPSSVVPSVVGDE